MNGPNQAIGSSSIEFGVPNNVIFLLKVNKNVKGLTFKGEKWPLQSIEKRSVTPATLKGNSYRIHKNGNRHKYGNQLNFMAALHWSEVI